MTKKLTKTVIDAQTAREATDHGRFTVWDSALPGLGVRIAPSGRKVFVLSYRANRRKRLLTLGVYGAITLDQARDLARVRLGEVVMGGDPVEQRKKTAQGETVHALCEAYLEGTPHGSVQLMTIGAVLLNTLFLLGATERRTASHVPMWQHSIPRSGNTLPMRRTARLPCSPRCLNWPGAGASCQRTRRIRPEASTSSKSTSGIGG